jgi:hypothetical protein
MSLLLIGDREIQGKDRCRDHGGEEVNSSARSFALPEEAEDARRVVAELQ